MHIEITHGATVVRLYDDDQTEFIGAFQYESDATAFAKLKMSEDAARKWLCRYAVVNTYNGKITMFSPEKADAAKAA